ncbi:hypothetical protein JCM33374_g4992 [Metschnikowia sp. JCM 33374]|nr:hypothetical protein JCM33374_g4992 [Metschnikowia sp. JCM 33374]
MTAPEKAFVNSFWGQKDDGFAAIQMRIQTSLATLHELLDFYKEKISIEKEYNKRLSKLASSLTLGSGEIGTLKIALDKLQNESANMIAQDQGYIRTMSSQNYDKLLLFYQNYHKSTSKIEAHMQKILSKKHDYGLYLDTAKEKFRVACGQQKTLTLLCQTTWGKELDKNTAKLRKVQSQLSGFQANYHNAVQKYAEIHEIWVRDWSLSLSSIYQLEIERVQVCKLNCFAFCNHVASLCVEWDSAVDLARSAFAKVGASRDVHDFVASYGTGSQIPVSPEYVDYLNGYGDDTPKFINAEFKDPDYSHIVSRTYSTHSSVVSKYNSPVQGSPSQESVHQMGSGPIAGGAMAGGALAPRIGPPEDGAFSSEYATGDPQNPNHTTRDLHAPYQTLQPAANKSLPPIKQPLQPAGGGDAYDHEHDHVHDHDDHDPAPHDAPPLSPPKSCRTTSKSTSRKNPRIIRQPHKVQSEINRRSQDLSELYPSLPDKTKEERRKSVPIAKDFSIDFIAKALEDLNAGGDGDMNKFRRSVRLEKEASAPAPAPVKSRAGPADSGAASAAAAAASAAPPSDFIDDSGETATRYDSISFRRPDRFQASAKPPAKLPSMSGDADESLGTVVKTRARRQSQVSSQAPPLSKDIKRRSFSQTPTKSYVNLSSLVDNVTPVTRNKYETKAVARYSYKAQEQGEVSFRKGWYMYVIHKQEDNWYVCELGENCGEARGAVGLVPYNYIVEGDQVF